LPHAILSKKEAGKRKSLSRLWLIELSRLAGLVHAAGLGSLCELIVQLSGADGADQCVNDDRKHFL
jgi:hypothetical protein